MSTKSKQTNIRSVELARAYKFCIKRIMDVVDARTGGDEVIRSAVMAELAVFHQKANDLVKEVDAHILEELYQEVKDLICRYTPTLGI